MRRGSRGRKPARISSNKSAKDKSKDKKPKKKADRRPRTPKTALASRDLSAKHPAHGVWMIIEVNDDGESLFERYDLIEAEIIAVFGDDTAFFIPSYIERVKDKVIGIDLIGGYVFVEVTDSSESRAASMTSHYFKGRMSGRGRSSTVSGRDINDYKRRLLDSIKGLAPKKGTMVVPKVGTFKNIEGKVVSVSRDRKSATVIFKKSSRIVQAPVSVLNMERSSDTNIR